MLLSTYSHEEIVSAFQTGGSREGVRTPSRKKRVI